VLGAHVPGRTFLLKSKRIGAVSVGSPIFFRDLNVGEVLGWDIADMAEYVTIHAFVRAPYDSYLHDETRFWNASGVSVKLSGTEVDVQMESLKALLLGGVAFETPVAEIYTAETSENHVFPLFSDRETSECRLLYPRDSGDLIFPRFGSAGWFRAPRSRSTGSKSER